MDDFCITTIKGKDTETLELIIGGIPREYQKLIKIEAKGKVYSYESVDQLRKLHEKYKSIKVSYSGSAQQ